MHVLRQKDGEKALIDGGSNLAVADEKLDIFVA